MPESEELITNLVDTISNVAIFVDLRQLFEGSEDRSVLKKVPVEVFAR